MKARNSKISRLAIPLMMVSGLLASSISALADSDDQRCSNRTLSGDYGWAAQGLVSPGPPPPVLPFTAVGTAHFDGKGNLSWLEHTVINGVPQGTQWTMATGTYTVNANCTGTAVVNTPNSPVPLNISLAVIKHGKEIRSVVDGHAISNVFIKSDD